MAENQSAEAATHEKSHRAEPAPREQGNLEGLYAPQLPLSALQLLGDPRLNGRGNRPVKTAVMQQMQRTYGNRATQRFLQRAAANHADPSTEDIGTRIQTKAGTGNSLDASVRERIEPGLGADLSGVRLHTDPEADQMARSVDAVAFTTGSDIFFRDGAYNPTTSDGLRLLAHEATHTVQQGAGPVAGTPTEDGVSISDPSDSFEQAAERTAEAVVSGNPAPQAVSNRPAASVQRHAVQDDGEMPVQTMQASSPGGHVPVQREGATSSPGAATTPGQKGVGGKQTFTTKKLNVPASTPMGPIEYAGADAYAEINYELFDPGQEAGAKPGSDSSTQVRAGVAKPQGDIGVQGEIQKQWEPIAAGKLGSFKPTVKGGGNLTKKGGEIAVEGGVEGEKFSTSLKFTILGTNFEKGEIEFATLTSQWEFPVFKPEPMKLSDGRQASTDIKAKFDFKFKPNYKEMAKWLTEALAELGLEGAATLGLELAVITGPLIAMAVTIQVGEAKNQLESEARMGAISVRGAAQVYGLNMIGSDGGGNDKAAEQARAKGKKDFAAMAQKSGLSQESFRNDMITANTKGKFYDARRFSKEALQAADFPYRKKAGDAVNAWASEHYILAAFTDMRYFHKKVDDIITEQFNKL